MDNPLYAYGVFMQHFERSGKPKKGFVGLELGPGDSLLSAMTAHSVGASAYYLIDTGPFVRETMEPYRNMARFLAGEGLPTLDETNLMSLKSMLAACRATYSVQGLQSLKELPAQSVDFIWSHAVLEHLGLSEFRQILTELRRIIRQTGISSHRVDLKDHIGGALNHLRFSDWLWESRAMSQSGFYTNRIRLSEMLDLFKQADFSAEIVGIERWSHMPTPKTKLSAQFRNLPDEELRVSAFDVILRPM
jgi:hypothetical protein